MNIKKLINKIFEGDGQPGFDVSPGDEAGMDYVISFVWDNKRHSMNVSGNRYPTEKAMVNATLAKFLRSKGLDGKDLNLGIWKIKNSGNLTVKSKG